MTVVSAIVIATLAANADAQRGTFTGELVERTGASRPANIYPVFRFPGTEWSTELENRRFFRVEVFPGRYELDVFVTAGAPSERRTILLEANETIELIITGPEGRGPWGKPTNVEEQVPPSDSLVNMSEARVVYHTKTPPVVAKSLEFTVRYEMTEIDDSMRVDVTAEGRNNSQAKVNMCGCLSFWRTEFALGPEQMGDIPFAYVKDWYKGPELHVAPVECTSPVLDCTPTTLAPGEAVARSMSFSFRPADFAEKTGELWIRTYYFSGAQGVEWHDAERVALGILAVPLRLPGTVGRYRF